MAVGSVDGVHILGQARRALTCWKQDRAVYWTSARAGVVAGLQITAPSGCAMFLLSSGAGKIGKV